MRITISEVNTLADAAMAAGLTSWFIDMGLAVDAPSAALPLSVQPVRRPSAEVPAAGSPVCSPVSAGELGTKSLELPVEKRELGGVASKRVVPKPQPVKRAAKATSRPAAATGGGDRLTIRQRILNYLAAGPKTSAQVASALQSVGLDVRVDQHLYLLMRDKLVARDDDAGTYGLKKR